MLDAYDNLNIKDAWVIEKQGECVEELVDVIIEKLNRLLNSKTRLSCRNVLVTNFKTMTKTEHWLERKLFMDLPKDLGKVLRDKIEQMVDLLNALMVKIINVEADFADEFLERMKKRCRKYSTTGYDLWKAQQSKIPIHGLVTYQVDLTADMLSCGILKYARRPNGEEIQNVNKDKLALKLTDKSIITDAFIRECAKLRRYSHWEGDRFVIDYHLLRKYLFCEFGKLTCEQHIKMYEYDIQMKQIHEDIKRLEEEEMCVEGGIEEIEEEMKEKEEKPIAKGLTGLRAFVVKQEIAELVIAKITELVNMESKPKNIIRPIRAAMDAGVLYRPSWEAFIEEFGRNKVRSKSSLNDYTNPEIEPYTGKSYKTLVDIFKQFLA
jgi:hypothetical protein